MIDIVERLRAPAYWISGSSEGHEGDNAAPLQAAAEIERLNSELTDAVTDLNTARQDNASCTAHIHNQAARIETLEAALQEIDMACSNPGSWSPVVMERIIERVQELSRAALTQEKNG